jgi:M6 family metalloprotease-like protein
MNFQTSILKHIFIWACAFTPLTSTPPAHSQTTGGSSGGQVEVAKSINLLPPLTHTSWQLSQVGEAAGKKSVEDDALKITVDVADGTDWHLQLHHDTRNVINDQFYRLSFEAKADRPRDIIAYGQMIGRQGKGTGLWLKANLSPQWQTFRTVFKTKDVAAGQHFLPNFLFGAQMGDVWLRNVSLTPVGSSASGAHSATSTDSNSANSPTTAAKSVTPSINPLGWLQRNFEGAVSNIVQEEGATRINVTKAGTANWHVQLAQGVKDMHEGQRYVLKVRVRADGPHNVGIYFTTESDPSENIGLNTGIMADTEWQEFRFPFTARGVEGQDCVLQFLVGDTPGTVWIGDVNLETAASGTVDSASAKQWPITQYNTYADVQAKEHKVLVARISFDDTEDIALPLKSYYEKLFSNEWPWLGHYFRSVSYGAARFTGTATEMIRLPGSWRDYCVTENGRSTFYHRTSVAKLDSALSRVMSLDGYTHVVYVPNHLSEDPARRSLSSSNPLSTRNYKWSIIPQATGTNVFVHELMHTFGLGHSYVLGSTRKVGGNRWDGGFGNWGEYRHPFTGDSVPGDWIAYSKMKAKWMPNDRIYNAGPGTDAIVRIERIAEPTTKDPLVVVVDPTGRGTRFWTVEARKEAGYDFGSIAGEAVVIHECVIGRKHPSTMDRGEAAVVEALNSEGTGADEGSRWVPGETYENKEAGFSIKVLSSDATGFTLLVRVKPGQTASAS